MLKAKSKEQRAKSKEQRAKGKEPKQTGSVGSCVLAAECLREISDFAAQHVAIR